jgi:hypothetical protein
MRLAELNNFHQMQNLKRDLNPSQCGTGDCFRNASLNSAYILLDSAWFTELPEVGRLRFDYVSPLRCPEGLPPSSGSWGCSFEGYGQQTAASGDNDSLAPSLYGGANEEGVYDETAEHFSKFSSLHGKEQFVQELVENLFAKKFEPRSKAKRKETRSCAKNIPQAPRRGGPKGTGKFYDGMHSFAKAVGVAKDTPSKPKAGYVDRIKKIGFDAPALGDSTYSSEHSSGSESSEDEFGLKKPTEDTVTAPEGGGAGGSPNREDSFSQWHMRSKMFQKPPTPAATETAQPRPASSAPASPVKLKPKPPNKLREAYLSEVTEYWRDTADTCWARCRATHIDLLKKKLDEAVQEELRGKPAEKDIK